MQTLFAQENQKFWKIWHDYTELSVGDGTRLQVQKLVGRKPEILEFWHDYTDLSVGD